jgi:tRNA_anti-like
MKNSKKAIIFSGLVVVLLAILSGLYLFNKKHPDLTSVKPNFTLSAEHLIDEVEADETKATEKYQDKILEVIGQISHIDIAEDGTITLTLMNENQFAGVICTLSKENDSVEIPEIGNEVIVRGTFSGVLMDVLLNNCVIIK